MGRVWEGGREGRREGERGLERGKGREGGKETVTSQNKSKIIVAKKYCKGVVK